MAAERINAAAIAVELDVLDGEAKRVAGNLVVAIGFTNAAVKSLAPHEWEQLAAYLMALIAREPMKSSPALTGHRIVLGALATELRGFAHAAGEPVGIQADLRAATTQGEERRLRARLADIEAGAHRYFDDVLTAHQIQQTVTPPALEPQEEPIDQPPPAADPTENDDALAYL